MELAPAGVPISFEVTYDRDDLDVGMSVYDTSGSSPVLVSGPAAMILVAGYTYSGKFTATDGKPYVIIKGVYTDNTFTTLSPDYAQGSESIYAQSSQSSSSPISGVVGYIDNPPAVIGIVEC